MYEALIAKRMPYITHTFSEIRLLDTDTLISHIENFQYILNQPRDMCIVPENSSNIFIDTAKAFGKVDQYKYFKCMIMIFALILIAMIPKIVSEMMKIIREEERERESIRRREHDFLQAVLNHEEAEEEEQRQIEYVNDEFLKLQLTRNEGTPPTVNKKYSHECSICLQDFASENPVVMTTCEHFFHRDCITQWTSHTCPLCRSPCQIVDDVNFAPFLQAFNQIIIQKYLEDQKK